MARKNLLGSLIGAELPAGNSSFGPSRGAVGAVSRSIEQIRALGVAELKPDLIDASFIEDRLSGGEEDIESLVESMREHGQQVPILVRPHPETPERYQIAYGRRRLRAAAALGRNVRAVVKPLTDAELVVAQGQENIERRDLSFIERALFAAQLEARGFSRETLMAALGVDKTGLSRLIGSATRIPADLIRAIGPAPKTGRDRWSALAALLEDKRALERARAAAMTEKFTQAPTDARFASVLRAASAPEARPARASVVKTADGRKLAQVRNEPNRVSLVLDRRGQGDFAAFLIEELPALHARFSARKP